MEAAVQRDDANYASSGLLCNRARSCQALRAGAYDLAHTLPDAPAVHSESWHCNGSVDAAVRRKSWPGQTAALRMGVTDGGDAREITSQGVTMLTYYLLVERLQVINELGRHRYAVEQAEWAVQRLVTDFIVRLVIEARRATVLAVVTVHVVPWSPMSSGMEGAESVLPVAWQPRRQQVAPQAPWTMLDVNSEAVGI